MISGGQQRRRGQHAASQPPGDQERGAVQAGPGIGEFDFFPGDAAQGNAGRAADLAAVGVGADHGVRRAGLQQGEDVRHMESRMWGMAGERRNGSSSGLILMW